MKKIVGKKKKAVISDDLKFGRFASNLKKSKLDRSQTIEQESKKEPKIGPRQRMGARSNRKKVNNTQLSTVSQDSRQVIERPDVQKWLASRGASQKRDVSSSQNYLGRRNEFTKIQKPLLYSSQKPNFRTAPAYPEDKSRDATYLSAQKLRKARVFSQNRSQVKFTEQSKEPRNRFTFGKLADNDQQPETGKIGTAHKGHNSSKRERQRSASVHKLKKVTSNLFMSQPGPAQFALPPPNGSQRSGQVSPGKRSAGEYQNALVHEYNMPADRGERLATHEKNREASSFGDLLRNPYDRETMGADLQPVVINGREDVEKMRRLSRLSEDNSEERFFVEFQEMELNSKLKQKYGGLRSIMTPRFKSKRLSRARKSSGIDDDSIITPSKKCSPLSTSDCKVR